MKQSETLSQFLVGLRQIKSDYKTNYEYVSTADKAQQDLLHKMEFGSYEEARQAGARAHKLRRKRRQAKDFVAAWEPIIKFMDKHRSALNDMSQLLGLLKSAEKPPIQKYYTARVLPDCNFASAKETEGKGNANQIAG